MISMQQFFQRFRFDISFRISSNGLCKATFHTELPQCYIATFRSLTVISTTIMPFCFNKVISSRIPSKGSGTLFYVMFYRLDKNRATPVADMLHQPHILSCLLHSVQMSVLLPRPTIPSGIGLCGFLKSLYAHRQGIAYCTIQIKSD